MNNEELKAIVMEAVREVVCQDYLPSLLSLLERSESRIDKINSMIKDLIHTIDSMEKSRDLTQRNSGKLIENNALQLAEVTALRNELLSAKDSYNTLLTSYLKIAERNAGSGTSRSDVKINV